MISKVKLIVALSCLGLLLWLGYAWIYNKPSIEKTFVAQTLTFNDEATTAFCLANKTEHGLFTQQTTHYPVVEAFKQKANYLQKINTCQTEFDDAIAHDEMLESALYKGHLDAFFKRARQDPSQFSRPLMLHMDQLPDAISSQLRGLPKGYEQLTVFDVALANKRIDDVLHTMPNADAVLPHQRQVLFHLGAFSVVAQAVSNSDQTLAEDKLNRYQAQMNNAFIKGDVQLAAKALSSLFANTGSPNGYADYRGGFSDYDFLLANQGCDLKYATFLTRQPIKPSARHILHLLSVIGHAQYPGIGDEFSQFTFTYADPALGTPNVKDLPQCLALAKLYAGQVQGLNDPDLIFSTGYYQTNVYDELYKIANDGVFQWWVRANEKQYQNGRAPNTQVNGNPSLLIEAVAEILKQQPASYEQYCAWANNAHSFSTLVKNTQPAMVAPMLALPKVWSTAEFYYQQPSPRCTLSFGITDEYQYQHDGLAYMNKMLKQVGIPCQGQLAKDNGAYQLSCDGAHKPWPTNLNTTELNEPS